MPVNVTITGPIQLTRGLRANLPTVALIGQAFFCTDTGEVFIWNGSAMVGPAAAQATEIAARIAAVTAEATARANADSAEVTARTAAIGVETTRATAAEAAINTALAGKQTIINFVDAELPSGQGAGNTVLTLAHAPGVASSLRVFRNGVRQTVSTDYTLSGVTLTLILALSSTDIITVDYRY